jgi:endo-1,4-beta-xylanase
VTNGENPRTSRKFRRLFVVFSAVVAALVMTGGAAGASGQAPARSETSALVYPGTIQGLYDFKCLDVYGNGAGPWVQAWWCNGQSNQVFYRVFYPDTGDSEFRTSDHWCVDGRWGRGASLERSPCTGHPGQRWHLEPAVSGFVIRSSLYPNLVWDVYGNGRGTEVQLWDSNGQWNQRWQLNMPDTAISAGS